MENFLSRQVTVIELPQEYAAAESGDAPIYLYHIFARAPIDYHWRYTSFASDIWSDNKLHTAAAITHGKLVRSVELTVQTVEVTTAYGTRNPFSLMLPFPTGRPMSIEIRQATAADPDTATLLFAGTVRQVNDAGTHLVAQCDNFFSTFKKRIPPMLIKPQCDYQLFEPRTCKAVEALYTAEGFITAIDNTAQPPTVELSLRFPLFPTGQKLVADHFAQGWFTTGIELNYEARTIFSSTWNTGTQRMLIETNGPLINAIVGQEILLRPGCDGEATTCVSKFDNFIHYPGFQFVPANNPSLQAIESKASQGNKK
jgi:hypothetical protein